MRDYYAILDLPSTATMEQVDARYRQFARMFDPTLYTEPAELAYVRKKLTAVEEAYQALRSRSLGLEGELSGGIVGSAFSTSAVQHRQIDFTSGDDSGKHVSSNSRTGRVRWLHKFLLTSATILVAALVGTAALEQGLGVWAYVVALQQGKSLSALPRAIDPAQTGNKLVAQAGAREALSIQSPNQQQAALVASIMGKEQIFLQDVDHNKVEPLSHAINLRSLPLWSPQADKLAFIEDQANGPTIQVFVLATRHFYTFQPPATLGQLGRIAWNAEGSVLLFETYAGKATTEVTLWRIDSTGQNLSPYAEPVAPEVNWSKSLP